MNMLVFDSGPIISITSAGLMDMLYDLKKIFNGDFVICEGVKKEIVDVPIKSRRNRFEAFLVNKAIEDGVIKVVKAPVVSRKLLSLANTAFIARGHPVTLLHAVDVESVAIAVENNCALVMDERTTRLMVEDAGSLERLLEKRLRTDVTIGDGLDGFRAFTKNLKIIRSAELGVVAFERGLLDKYKPARDGKSLLDAVLWELKTNGCAISEDEIEKVLRSK